MSVSLCWWLTLSGSISRSESECLMRVPGCGVLRRSLGTRRQPGVWLGKRRSGRHELITAPLSWWGHDSKKCLPEHLNRRQVNAYPMTHSGVKQGYNDSCNAITNNLVWWTNDVSRWEGYTFCEYIWHHHWNRLVADIDSLGKDHFPEERRNQSICPPYRDVMINCLLMNWLWGRHKKKLSGFCGHIIPVLSP